LVKLREASIGARAEDMNQKTRQSIERIAREEFPGCSVEITPNGNRLRIDLDGSPISTNKPPDGWQEALDTDDKIRSFVRRICPRADRRA
jgi:hypothetical protein